MLPSGLLVRQAEAYLKPDVKVQNGIFSQLFLCNFMEITVGIDNRLAKISLPDGHFFL
jgi:hypothetical protein